jgi:hypothetical protein
MERVRSVGMACRSCGVEDPTRYVEFKQNIGMVIARQSSRNEGELCRPCMKRYFRSYTLTTLFLGWWGMISLLVTPVFLANNVYEYWRTRDLPAPDRLP